ncbi:MAG: GNAT family N-acetyltransferase [Pirellulales bacterium]|nr:GNAT family N-acetyltransferase [Pirellulales bacterium]
MDIVVKKTSTMPVFQRLRRMFTVKRYNVSCISGPSDIIDIPLTCPIALEEVNSYNVHNVTDFQPDKHSNLFEKSLREGQCGVYAVDNSVVCGHAWAVVCRNESGRSIGYYRLRAGEAMIHYCEVEPSHRGRAIYPAMLCSLCKRLLGKEKMTKVFVNTELDNAPALRSIVKVGFTTVGNYVFVLFRGRLVYKRRLADLGPPSGIGDASSRQA